MTCENKQQQKCMKCQRYSVNEHHGYRDKPSEDIILCPFGGVKKWQYINGRYVYKENEDDT